MKKDMKNVFEEINICTYINIKLLFMLHYLTIIYIYIFYYYL